MKKKRTKRTRAVLLVLLSLCILAAIYFFTKEKVALTEQQSSSSTTRLGQLFSNPTPSPTPTLPPLPSTKVLTGGTHVFQTFNNCGPASLSMALSYYGQAVSQQTLGNALRPFQRASGDNDDKSVTLAELAQKASEYGYTTYHRPAGDTELLKQFVAHDMPVITRTWLKPGEDIGHYRVVIGYDETRGVLFQDDSLQGKNLAYSYADFDELWQAFNYEFLVLVPADKQEVAQQILGERADENAAWEHAYELSESQLQKDPSNMYAQFNQAVALFHLGKHQETVELYEKIESSLPNRMLWYQIEPIMAYYKLGDYDKVLSISEQILNNQNRAYSELHGLRAQIFQSRGQGELATDSFRLANQYNASEYWKTNVE